MRPGLPCDRAPAKYGEVAAPVPGMDMALRFQAFLDGVDCSFDRTPERSRPDLPGPTSVASKDCTRVSYELVFLIIKAQCTCSVFQSVLVTESRSLCFSRSIRSGTRTTRVGPLPASAGRRECATNAGGLGAGAR